MRVLFCLFLFFLAGVSYFFWGGSSYYFFIPIHIDEYWGTPMVQIEIGEKNYQVELDLGTKLSTLSRKELGEIDKKFYGSFSSLDIHGNTYESDIYQVFGVKIYDFFVPAMKIREESSAFVNNSAMEGDSDKILCLGRIGREVFEGKNFLLDFSRSRVILCKNFRDLYRDEYKAQNFIQVPFLINTNGICFQVETDTGTKTLVLDSGSSHSLMRQSLSELNLSTQSFYHLPLWQSKKFILGDFDFGPKDFYLFEISSLVTNMDGILGMDFLKEHAVYLDIGRSVAYIEFISVSNIPVSSI